MINIVISDDIEVRQEALWVLTNSARFATDEQIATLVGMNVIKALSFGLSMNKIEDIYATLKALENVFKAGGQSADNTYVLKFEECEGVEKLEKL